MHIYLVGGAVRDKLLGRPVKDRDFGVVGATGQDFLRRFPSAKPVGRLGLTYIYKGEEYTLSRAATMQDDLLTRDLTMNALAEAGDGTVIGPPGALDDLRARILRPVACANFHTDPHRVFRAARFAAGFPDWRVADELKECMREIAGLGLLDGIAAERVGQELVKACACQSPGRFFRLLRDTDGLTPWFVPFSRGDLDQRTGYMDKAVRTAPDGVGKRAVWLIACAVLAPEEAEPLARRLKLSLEHIREAVFASRWLERTVNAEAATPEALSSAERVDMLLHMDRLGLSPALARAVSVCAGCDEDALLERLGRQAGRVRAVHLPESAKGRGPESGRILLGLRVAALHRR